MEVLVYVFLCGRRTRACAANFCHVVSQSTEPRGSLAVTERSENERSEGRRGNSGGFRRFVVSRTGGIEFESHESINAPEAQRMSTENSNDGYREKRGARTCFAQASTGDVRGSAARGGVSSGLRRHRASLRRGDAGKRVSQTSALRRCAGSIPAWGTFGKY